MMTENELTVLAIDTSTASLAAAAVRGGVLLGSVQSLSERNHSVQIVPVLQKLLKDCGLAGKDLDVIAVGQGPGSYTGVRIAVSVGKTLAWTWNKPLIGVSSLETLALGAWEAHGKKESGSGDGTIWVIPVMDARRGQVYTARWAADASGRWERMDADGIRLAAEWMEKLGKEASSAGIAEIWIVGDPEAHAEIWKSGEAGSAAVRLIPHLMEAGPAAKLAAWRYRRGERDPVHAFVPNYTQLAEAEAKLLAARGD
jgi:tRNA threonylcarbamoyladenosine biosynthesis protein TsaB